MTAFELWGSVGGVGCININIALDVKYKSVGVFPPGLIMSRPSLLEM